MRRPRSCRPHPRLMDVSRLNGPPEALASRLHAGAAHQCGGSDRARPISACGLLLEADVSEAARIAAELDRLNTERRVIETDGRKRRRKPRRWPPLGLEDKGSVIVTASEGWHPGVVGSGRVTAERKILAAGFCHWRWEPGGIGTGFGPPRISGRRSRQGGGGKR